jgi:DNA-binding transcriptional LysR family regulator
MLGFVEGTLDKSYVQLLPQSLTTVRVFDAAASHLSCSRAAEELFLTQSAVSKHLQSLEVHLGVKLFKRVHQGLALTEAGATYWEAIKPVLSMLASATEKARMVGPDQSTIHIGVPNTFAEKWLMRRMADFSRRHPDIDVQFAPRQGATSEQAAFSAEIRSGRGNWEGVHAHYLMGREFFPVCSPAYIQNTKLASPGKLSKLRLLEHARLPHLWDQWFSARQVRGYDSRKTQQYERFSVMISALQAGLGAALVPRCLIETELENRVLTIPFEQSLKTEFGYYLVYPKDRYPSAALERFSQWLLAEAECTARSTAGAAAPGASR